MSKPRTLLPEWSLTVALHNVRKVSSMTTTAPANSAAFDLLKNQVMVNADRTMAGRLAIASVPSPVGSQEPTYVDAYQIQGDEVVPVLTLTGSGGLAMSLMHDIMSVTPKDFVVVTTTIKRRPEDTDGRRVVIGMGIEARPLAGVRDFKKVLADDGRSETIDFDKDVAVADFNTLDADFRNWILTMIQPKEEPHLDRLRHKLLSINSQHIGIFAYGHGPLKSSQKILGKRGWLGTDAGSSANINAQNPPAAIDLMIALLSVLTPTQTYQDIAATRRALQSSN